MKMSCTSCGYSGALSEFRYVSKFSCCGPNEMRLCPKCRQTCLYDKMEAREYDEEKARELCMMLENIIEAEDAVDRESAMKIITELEQINISLGIEGLRLFIGSKKKELRLA